MSLIIENSIHSIKNLNLFLAANLNSSFLWVESKLLPQTLHHLVIAMKEELTFDVSSDNLYDLENWLHEKIKHLEKGDTVDFSPVDIREGKIQKRNRSSEES